MKSLNGIMGSALGAMFFMVFGIITAVFGGNLVPILQSVPLLNTTELQPFYDNVFPILIFLIAIISIIGSVAFFGYALYKETKTGK